VLVVAMSAALTVRYSWLVAFTALALLLFLRLNLTRQHAGWERRLIADGRGVTGPFLRGGAALVALAVAGAAGLAYVASASPLAGSWRVLDGVAFDVAQVLDRWTGGFGAQTTSAASYPDRQSITGVWNADQNTVLFSALADDPRDFYWTAATYDRFDGQDWWQTNNQSHPIGAGEDALAGTDDALPEPDAGRLLVGVTVTNLDPHGSAMTTLLAPAAPYALDRPASVRTAGEDGSMAAIDFAEPVPPGQSYVVESLVPDPDDQSVFTEAVLSAAGTAYPEWVQRYLRAPDGAVGELTKRQAYRIRDSQDASERDPFHLADAVEDYLRGPGFQFQTDVSDVCRNGQTVSDCLLEFRRGYCQYYATTMVMMLRSLEVPARYVQGYLPGNLADDGRREVTAAAAHAWVEVYFPGIGWFKFDPTPGAGNLEGQQPTSLPPGEPGTTVPDQTPEPSLDPAEPEPTPSAAPIPPDEAAAPIPPSADPIARWGGPLLITGLLALALVIGALAVWIRRRPALEPEIAFRGIVAVATRFGYARQANQTPYEYTASLSRVVPGVATELHTVARAKVESTYAHRAPDRDALSALRRAYRRARVGLIRLFFRPPVGD
jgi:transglutaminase-like putative cysteine protease